MFFFFGGKSGTELEFGEGKLEDERKGKERFGYERGELDGNAF